MQLSSAYPVDKAHLSKIIIDEAPHEGNFATAIPELMLFRRDSVSEPCSCLIEPSIVVVTQGQKRLLIGDHNLHYDTGRFLVNSLDLPAASEVVSASSEEPCLGFVVSLNFRLIADLVAQGLVPNQPVGKAKEGRGVSTGVGTMTSQLLEPLARLVELMREPQALPALAPLYLQEIHFRLMCSDQAWRLRQAAAADSQNQRIARAVNWLKQNYNQPFKVEDLANSVQMSTTSFHQHFRQLTAKSPLQYQKWLRLTEAKRLMLNEALDASSASYQVGYESPSQFNREYSRLFGTSPKKDIQALRDSVRTRI
ncbi:AraC family transcriptional regulator [Halioxenophilus aromaticivorans]|uniref:AraC family transcriptional regulator n=1 Tax=Halioxenophilus aromaticivorans TaxID=1306992 RepID=A0AAV3U3X7_9ALTE